VADRPRDDAVGADHLVLLLHGDATLNGSQQAFHGEILNAIRTCTKHRVKRQDCNGLS